MFFVFIIHQTHLDFLGVRAKVFPVLDLMFPNLRNGMECRLKQHINIVISLITWNERKLFLLEKFIKKLSGCDERTKPFVARKQQLKVKNETCVTDWVGKIRLKLALLF